MDKNSVNLQCENLFLKISSNRLLMSCTKPTSGVPEFLRIDNMSANEYVSTDFLIFLHWSFCVNFRLVRQILGIGTNLEGMYLIFLAFFLERGPEIYGFCDGTKTYLKFVDVNVFDLYDLQFFLTLGFVSKIYRLINELIRIKQIRLFVCLGESVALQSL